MLDAFDRSLDPTFAPHDRAALIHRLKAVLPVDGLLVSDEAMAVYESDGLAAYRGLPGVGCRRSRGSTTSCRPTPTLGSPRGSPESATSRSRRPPRRTDCSTLPIL